VISDQEKSAVNHLEGNLQNRIIGNHSGSFALITVSDRGPGIPPTDRERIFEKFYQAEHGKKAPGQGAGLGLAICMTIMQAHRGAIWAEDNPGGGSRFCVLLSRLTTAGGQWQENPQTSLR
jgi:signal transduction histidine kinase